MSLQSILMVTFSVLSLGIIVLTASLVYLRFSAQSQAQQVTTTQATLRQAKEMVDDYLVRMRQISDAAYYTVVKQNDVGKQAQTVRAGMNTLYEGNKDDLVSLAIYTNVGELLAAEPVAVEVPQPQVAKQEWFAAAQAAGANVHFSTPHVQHLFDPGSPRFRWVISLSRVVELNQGQSAQTGVLLVDMDYYQIAHRLEQLNDQSQQTYYYLSDQNGRLIYHPKQQLIAKGLAQENNQVIAKHQAGVYRDVFEKQNRTVVVQDVSYTGWKLVAVMPPATFRQTMLPTALFVALAVVLMAMVLILIDRLISLRISRPLARLNASVVAYETSQEPTIYIGGSSEIRHLGQSIQASYQQIEGLLNRVIQEQNERRKTELAALQSQINPHFLYNTLDSITWMIEGGRNDKAVFMITQLAKLFRISLSKGKTIISLNEECQHAQSYMNIQQERYQNRMHGVVSVPEAIGEYLIPKLVLQPIIENSINYGMRDVDDDPLTITIKARLEAGDLVIDVVGDGNGMDQEQVALLLTGSEKAHKHGSGVGLINVNSRLQLLFGDRYGLQVASELEEGTVVTLRLPAIVATPANRERLETTRRGESHEKA